VNEIKPRYIGGLAILFWGYQNDLLWFAIPMAIVLEARYFIIIRWALTKKDFYQIADLTGIVLLLMVLFLFLNRREYHFITTLISWLPILIYPLTIVLSYSTTPRMTLDILFYSLRRQREPVMQAWDMDYILLATCLLSAGLYREGSYYFLVVSAIIVLALYSLRSSRFNKRSFILVMALVLLSASLLHNGIRGAHLAVKEKTEEWIAQWIARRTDPFKTRTAIGQVGHMKLSDGIAFRIEPVSGKPDFPPLLQEAIYNTPDTTDWQVSDTRFNLVEQADDYRWEFAEQPMSQYPEARIYLEFNRKSSLVPVPGELAEIYELAALNVKKSPFGSILGASLIPAPHYRVRYQAGGYLGEEPSSMDLTIPEEHQPYLDSVTPAGLSETEALAFVQNFFHDFRYTLFQSGEAIQENPLIQFMSERKAGHCEYFASATALLLRQLGIPSRYVVGYAIEEWNDELSMYIVRHRHAHAWTKAWIDGRWIVIDTTPSQWFAMEESHASFLQPVADFFGNNGFLFLRWWNDQELEDYERALYIFGAILALVLLWRISRSEQVTIDDDDEDDVTSWILPGRESPFFRIENQLAEMGFGRGRGELMKNWLLRIDRAELLPMLVSHNRWRFDPQGLSMTERQALAKQVQEWLTLHPLPEKA